MLVSRGRGVSSGLMSIRSNGYARKLWWIRPKVVVRSLKLLTQLSIIKILISATNNKTLCKSCSGGCTLHSRFQILWDSDELLQYRTLSNLTLFLRRIRSIF